MNLSENSAQPVHATILIKIILLIILSMYLSGCTVMLWNGNGKYHDETVKKESAIIENVYLYGDRELAFPFTLTTKLKQSSSDFPSINQGVVIGYNNNLTGDKRLEWFVTNDFFRQIINGPIELDIKSVAITETRHLAKNRTNFGIVHPTYYEHYIDVSIDVAMPEQIISDSIKYDSSISKLISSKDNDSIIQYFHFLKPLLYSSLPISISPTNLVVKPIGFIGKDGSLINSLQQDNALKPIGIAVELSDKTNNDFITQNIKLIFGKVLEKQSGTSFTSTTRITQGFHELTPDKFCYIVPQLDLSKFDKLFPVYRNYPVNLEFKDIEAEPDTPPFVVKVLATPFTLALDIVIAPIYAVVALFMEGMPR